MYDGNEYNVDDMCVSVAEDSNYLYDMLLQLHELVRLPRRPEDTAYYQEVNMFWPLIVRRV